MSGTAAFIASIIFVDGHCGIMVQCAHLLESAHPNRSCKLLSAVRVYLKLLHLGELIIFKAVDEARSAAAWRDERLFPTAARAWPALMHATILRNQERGPSQGTLQIKIACNRSERLQPHADQYPPLAAFTPSTRKKEASDFDDL